MSVPILGALAFVLAAFLVGRVVARRSTPAPAGLTGLLTGRPADEPAGGSREHVPLAAPDTWRSAVVSDLEIAEQLLDSAEAAGYDERELHVLGNASFLVRWRERA